MKAVKTFTFSKKELADALIGELEHNGLLDKDGVFDNVTLNLLYSESSDNEFSLEIIITEDEV